MNTIHQDIEAEQPCSVQAREKKASKATGILKSKPPIPLRSAEPLFLLCVQAAHPGLPAHPALDSEGRLELWWRILLVHPQLSHFFSTTVGISLCLFMFTLVISTNLTFSIPYISVPLGVTVHQVCLVLRLKIPNTKINGQWGDK